MEGSESIRSEDNNTDSSNVQMFHIQYAVVVERLLTIKQSIIERKLSYEQESNYRRALARQPHYRVQHRQLWVSCVLFTRLTTFLATPLCGLEKPVRKDELPLPFTGLNLGHEAVIQLPKPPVFVAFFIAP